MLSLRNSLSLALVVLFALGGCATGSKSRDAAVEKADAGRFGSAFELMRNKEFPAAEKELLALRAQTPTDALVLTNLGIVYAHQKRLDEAEQALRQAIELDPKNAVAYNELGITLRRAGRFADAEEAYRASIKLRPAYAKAHYNLGVLLDLYLHQREQAIVHYEQYLALDNPDDKQVQAWVKDLQRRTGQGPSTAAAGAEVERR